MKVGIFGGSFNPIHHSHMYFAKECLVTLGLEKVIVIPTFTPPHKDASFLISGTHRLAMCRLAIENEPDFFVSDYEILKEGQSYTWETLEYFRKKHSHWEMYLLMGSDMYITLLDWKNPKEIFSRATVVGVAREHRDWEDVVAYEKNLAIQGATSCLLQIVPRPMSSTIVRELLKKGEPVEKYLDPKVLSYIKAQHLYREEMAP